LLLWTEKSSASTKTKNNTGLANSSVANAEGELDELFTILPSERVFDDTMRQWPMGKKVSRARVLIRRLSDPGLADLQTLLKEAQSLFAKRNALVHGRLSGGGRDPVPGFGTVQ
jgi:hypothetical protein